MNVFISYRRDDSHYITDRIYDWLIRERGRRNIFKDVDSIPLGRDFRRVIHDAVGRCDVLLVVIGPGWLTAAKAPGMRRLDDPDDFVRMEIEAAIERDIPIIPLLVNNATMPTAEDLPPSLHTLAYRNGLLVRPDPDFHNDMGRLIAALLKTRSPLPRWLPVRRWLLGGAVVAALTLLLVILAMMSGRVPFVGQGAGTNPPPAAGISSIGAGEAGPKPPNLPVKPPPGQGAGTNPPPAAGISSIGAGEAGPKPPNPPVKPPPGQGAGTNPPPAAGISSIGAGEAGPKPPNPPVKPPPGQGAGTNPPPAAGISRGGDFSDRWRAIFGGPSPGGNGEHLLNEQSHPPLGLPGLPLPGLPKILLQVVARFTVREGDKDGPTVPDAQVELVHRAGEGANATLTILGRGVSDAGGAVRLDLALAEDLRDSGQFLVRVRRAEKTYEWALPDFPSTTAWDLFVDRTHPFTKPPAVTRLDERLLPFGKVPPGWKQAGELKNDSQEIERTDLAIAGDFALYLSFEVSRAHRGWISITLLGADGGPDVRIEASKENSWSGVDTWWFTLPGGKTVREGLLPGPRMISLCREGEVYALAADALYNPKTSPVLGQFVVANSRRFGGVRLGFGGPSVALGRLRLDPLREGSSGRD